jgi:hypothetical protein
MIVQAERRFHLPCPNCKDGGWRVDQLGIYDIVEWECPHCHTQSKIEPLGIYDFEVTPALIKRRKTPITVTLRSITEPPITVKVNAWKYDHSQDTPQEDFIEQERYFYNEHTCPTNWLQDIQQIEFEGDTDPHGVFEFVSVADGHFVEKD